MIDLAALGAAVVLSIPAVILFTLLAGINRIAWRYALQIGVGSAAILALANIAARAPVASYDQGQLVLIGAILGGLVIRAYERGLAQRRAEIDRFLGISGSTNT